jgi:hypothetical protein
VQFGNFSLQKTATGCFVVIGVVPDFVGVCRRTHWGRFDETVSAEIKIKRVKGMFIKCWFSCPLCAVKPKTLVQNDHMQNLTAIWGWNLSEIQSSKLSEKFWPKSSFVESIPAGGFISSFSWDQCYKIVSYAANNWYLFFTSSVYIHCSICMSF